MDIVLRIHLLSPSASYFGVPVDEATYNKLDWLSGSKPSWTEIVGADALEADYLKKSKAMDDLVATDSDMARVWEDLLNVLINSGVVALTDLPQGAQNKIALRKAARDRL